MKGARRSSSSTLLGRLPGNTRCGSRAADAGLGEAGGAHLGLGLGGGLAAHQGLGLGDQVGEGDAVQALVLAPGVEHADEIHRHELRALVHQLEVGVLAVDALLAPQDRAGAAMPLVCRRGAPTCRWTPCRAAAGRRAGGAGAGGRGRSAGCAASRNFTFQMPSSAISTGRLAASGVVRKCASIACAPASSSSKRSGPRASTMGRPIALHSEKRPPTQSQKPNMLAVSMPKSRHRCGVGRHRDEVARDRGLVAEHAPISQARAAWALARVSWVVKVFEATMNKVAAGSAAAQHVADVHAVHVRHEVHAQAVPAWSASASHDHRRAEVGAADADVDDVGDRVRRRGRATSPPRTRLAEGAHARAHRMDLCGDVRASSVPARARRAAQRHMQHGAGLGGVDAFAVEHRLDAAGEPGLLGQAQQQRKLVVVEQVLRVIQGDAAGARPACVRCARDRRRSVRAGRAGDGGSAAGAIARQPERKGQALVGTGTADARKMNACRRSYRAHARRVHGKRRRAGPAPRCALERNAAASPRLRVLDILAAPRTFASRPPACRSTSRMR